MLGSRFSYVAYPLLVLDLTHSPARAGLVAFASRIPFALLLLPAGALVDRWDRKRVMLVCDAGRAGALASLVLVLWLWHLSFVQILVVAFVEGALTAFFQPAETAALRQIVPLEQMPDAVARNESREYAAFVSGPAIGGALFGISRVVPFAADALSYLVSFGAVAAVGSRLQEDRIEPRRALAAEIGEGLRWIWRQAFFRAGYFQAAASNLATNALGLVVIVIARRHGASAGEIGLMLTLVGVGGLAGSLAAPTVQRRVPHRTIIVGYCWVAAFVLAALAPLTNALALGLVFAVALFLAPIWNSVFGGYRIALTPDRQQGRVDSAGRLISFGAGPLGALVTGFLIEKIGTTPTVLAFAGWMGAVALAGTLSRSLRRIPELVMAEAGRP
jgi:MFS family permease